MTKWIFFDIGSTLVDESGCYRARYEAIARAAKVEFAAVEALAQERFERGEKGDAQAAKHFGAVLPAWCSEEERLFAMTREMLETLRARGYRLGVIANQAPGTAQRLEAFGIRECFDVIAASVEEGVAKPDAQIFLRALSRAGCAAEEAAMVGDRIDNDIVPAQKLGMKTVRVLQGPRKWILPASDAETPDWTIEDIRELPEIFR